MKNLRIRLFLSHLALSALLIGLCVAFILFVWYPGALARLEGVTDVLVVMAIVDVAAGPLCTLVVASPGKSRKELTRDLGVIGTVQFLALAYAVATTGYSRPAYVVYSFGQFEITRASQLRPEALAEAVDARFAHVPWFGPANVEAVLPADKAEADRIIASTMQGGLALKDEPRYYHAWPAPDTRARLRARGVAELWDKGELRPAAAALASRQGVDETDVLVAPIFGQSDRGTVVLRKSDLAILGIIAHLVP